ncbi:hypothetical protein ACFLY6_02375 [Candidatus Dependentiae bacterium]
MRKVFIIFFGMSILVSGMSLKSSDFAASGDGYVTVVNEWGVCEDVLDFDHYREEDVRVQNHTDSSFCASLNTEIGHPQKNKNDGLFKRFFKKIGRAFKRRKTD